MLNSLSVKWVSPTTIDVFTGKGWGNWTRFNIKRIKHQIYLEKAGGMSVDQDVFKFLCNNLDKSFPCDL